MNTLPLEKEVKFYINDLAAYEERLRRVGAILLQPRTHEINLRFDTPNLDLTREHKVLRLRQDNEVVLAYKGPGRTESGVLVRTEIELNVDDFTNAESFLRALGYSVAVRYEKWRTVYEMNQLEITLDEMPYGHFTEIEGEDESVIRSTAASLGLVWDCRIGEGYLALFEKLKKKMDLPVNHLTFNEFKNINITPADLGVKPADLPKYL